MIAPDCLECHTRGSLGAAARTAIDTREEDTQHVYNTSWPSWREQVSKREVGEDLRVYIFPQWKNWEWQMVIPAGEVIPSDQSG